MKNHGSYFMKFLLCTFLLMLCLSSTAVLAATIRVPQDYPNIQAGIDAATDADTVLVADGTYTGVGNKMIDFKGKAITVRSENGPTNTIIDCEGDGRGFSFGNAEGPDSVLDGFTIANGYVVDKGGGIFIGVANPTIKNCIITNNYAKGWGGGIYVYLTYYVMSDPTISPTITNCTISGNTAGQDGGGIYIFMANPTITNCIISGNTAYYGGGIEFSGTTFPYQPTITNSVITNNSAEGLGGGILCNGSSPTVTNCTISDNEVAYPSNSGGILIMNSSPSITNCIFWGDSPSEIDLSSGFPTITYSDVQGGYGGTGNINANPQFVGGGDYHLTASSPCIDAGTSEGAPDHDIDGDSRPQGAGYDMGADEYVGPIPPPISGRAMPWIPLLLLDD